MVQLAGEAPPQAEDKPPPPLPASPPEAGLLRATDREAPLTGTAFPAGQDGERGTVAGLEISGNVI